MSLTGKTTPSEGSSALRSANSRKCAKPGREIHSKYAQCGAVRCLALRASKVWSTHQLLLNFLFVELYIKALLDPVSQTHTRLLYILNILTHTTKKMATFKLASGYELPQVGFGLWKVPNETAADTVYNAIKAGYRLFDGAYDYQNEKTAGEGIKRAIDEGLVTRDEIFVTTKLWNNYHSREHVLEQAKKQNEAWGLGYIDLYLIHFPTALKYVDPKELEFPAWWTDAERTKVELEKVPISETWKALEEVVDLGIARSIGVSNFSAQLIYDIQTYNKHPISSLQIEHHPYLVQPELIQLAKENNIVITAYSSYGPQSFLELPGIFSQLAKEITPLLEHEVVSKIAKAHGKSPGQVLLRWSTQRGIAVIPKSNNPSRLAENLANTEFDLTEDEIKEISSLNKNLRFNDPGFYLPNFPLRIFA